MATVPLPPPIDFGNVIFPPVGPPGRIGSSSAQTAPAPRTASASSAHNMLKAVGVELAFVVVATMLAGISDSWGSGMVTLMLALLVLRGLFEVDLFAAFAQGMQFHP